MALVTYSDVVNISQTVFTKSGKEIVNGVYEIQKSATVLRKSDLARTGRQIDRFTLSWSHYLLLMRIEDPVERAFYEREATEGNWSFRKLERMYRASTFERLEISKDKKKVRCGEGRVEL